LLLLPRAAGAFDCGRAISPRDGGVNGRNPPPRLAGDGVTLRGDSILRGLVFEEPMLLRSDPEGLDDRLLLGGVNGRNPPLFDGAD